MGSNWDAAICKGGSLCLSRHEEFVRVRRSSSEGISAKCGGSEGDCCPTKAGRICGYHQFEAFVLHSISRIFLVGQDARIFFPNRYAVLCCEMFDFLLKYLNKKKCMKML